MRILRLKVEGFGALRGEFLFDPDRLTLLVDDNERGKSTLIAALAAGLYGLDDDRRTHRVVTPLERWRPWGGGPFRVELELDHEGERLVVARDFERGSVAVWNQHGQEITTEFRSGKDEFAVGQKLLGLDAAEFEKCALVRQGELDSVVPTDEKVRRASTLAARLENAADTRVGDTNASEALRVLDGALRRYTCPEVDSSGTVDTAVQRLELKRATLETEIKTLEHDLASIQEPLEALARLADEELATRGTLHGLEVERRGALAAGVRRQLEEQSLFRDELQRLRAEADGLSAAAHMPADAEARLHDAVARYQEAQRNLETLESRRREEIQRERGTLQKELTELQAHETLSAEDADECVKLATELNRITAEDSRLRDEVFSLRDALAGKGHDPERFQRLSDKFGGLSKGQQELLRRQSELALGFQTDVAGLEQERTESSETIREIDAQRNRWRFPGSVVIAMSVACAIGGIVTLAMKGLPMWWLTMFGAAAVGLIAGLGLLMGGGQSRAVERDEALQKLADALAKLNQMRRQRAETEVGLAELAEGKGYRGQVDLLKEWSEYARMMDESSPAVRAQDRLVALDAERRDVLERARLVLERCGGGTPDPATLERVAAGIRRLQGARARAAEVERNWSWIDEEKRVVEAQAAGLKERAIRILQAAGLSYDPDRSWSDHAQDLAERLKGKARLTTITEELIPRAAQRLITETAHAELESQLALIEAAGPHQPETATPRMTPLEIEAETRRLRDGLDRIHRERSDLRVQIEEGWRRYHAEHPEKLAQKERIEAALFRARRFKRSVELARETITSVAVETRRRWSDFLNHRVSELMAMLGNHVDQVRFGDDLDFSIRIEGSSPVPRGKADLQLSAGARDQLYLAVRLAVGEFLSRGGSRLPLLLDDVFVTSDDERTRNGMRVLIEHFSREHQILMLTCHRKRFEALAQLDPDLYNERVQLIDARSATLAT